MKPLIGTIIQARKTSTRFPNKVSEPLFGTTLLEWCVKGVRKAKLVDDIVIAAPHALGICLNEKLFIGSEADVLDRYYQCAKEYDFDVIVRITADCPLISGYEIDRCINSFLQEDYDYVTNCPAMPDGFDVEVFSFESLFEAWSEAKESYDREHVTPYIKNNSRCLYLNSPKLSVDTREDLDEIKRYLSYQTEASWA